MKATIPSLITTIRIVVAPIILYLLLSNSPIQIVVAVVLFFVAAYTDFIDGWLARRWKVQSSWGSFYDPLADKVLTLLIMYYIVHISLMPMWMYLVLTTRDVVVTALRWKMKDNDKPLQTSMAAKIKTFYQMIIVSLVLVIIALRALFSQTHLWQNIESIPINGILTFLLGTVTLYSAWTGIEYIGKGIAWKR
ncbi:MAG: CDP-diacylglycerol--glycerol-3-phosphate 3-phosphatidyltransferase [Candidatus Kapabacteria bacterium]|nr:CDP-diacylglycerol--glycerol-3-phosphate 3-phosphatidyltransferase [Candidatus Kapabacteria bacterium]